MSAIERIERFLIDWPQAEFGPAHIVLSDYNLEDSSIDLCLKSCESQAAEIPADELAATIAFLRELRAIPEDERLDGVGCPIHGLGACHCE